MPPCTSPLSPSRQPRARQASDGFRAFQALESLLDRAFGSANNPLRHLGALSFLFFWVILASGIYLYIFYDTGVKEAYQSVAALNLAQPWVGGVVRSLHRYASNAFLAVILS